MFRREFPNVNGKLGIAEQTYYRWKEQYAGLASNQVRDPKQLRIEDVRLEKRVAESSLAKAILPDIAGYLGADDFFAAAWLRPGIGRSNFFMRTRNESRETRWRRCRNARFFPR